MKSILAMSFGAILFASAPVLACECSYNKCMNSAKTDGEKVTCEAKKAEACTCKAAKKDGSCGCSAKAEKAEKKG